MAAFSTSRPPAPMCPHTRKLHSRALARGSVWVVGCHVACWKRCDAPFLANYSNQRGLFQMGKGQVTGQRVGRLPCTQLTPIQSPASWIGPRDLAGPGLSPEHPG